MNYEKDRISGAIDDAKRVTSIINQMSEFHKAQLALCDRLEGLADGLPDNFNKQEALHVARQVIPLVKRAHAFEESWVFDILKATYESTTPTAQSLERLKFEHWEDEAYAEDLSEMLISYAAKPDTVLAEKLSYMLRGFFDNLRRHIAFEMEFIAPVLMKEAEDKEPFKH